MTDINLPTLIITLRCKLTKCSNKKIEIFRPDEEARSKIYLYAFWEWGMESHSGGKKIMCNERLRKREERRKNFEEIMVKKIPNLMNMYSKISREPKYDNHKEIYS